MQLKFGRFFLDDHYLTTEEVFKYIEFLERDNCELRKKYDELNNGKIKRTYSGPSDHILNMRNKASNS